MSRSEGLGVSWRSLKGRGARDVTGGRRTEPVAPSIASRLAVPQNPRATGAGSGNPGLASEDLREAKPKAVSAGHRAMPAPCQSRKGGRGTRDGSVGHGPERIARGEEAQEPRPTARGRDVASTAERGCEASQSNPGRCGPQHTTAGRTGRRRNGRWARAAETPRHPRAGATPRRAEPQERRRGACEGPGQVARWLEPGSGTPAGEETGGA